MAFLNHDRLLASLPATNVVNYTTFLQSVDIQG
jgi:hypothetical protein